MIPASPSDRLDTAPPLRKSRVGGVVDTVLVTLLVIATLSHLRMVAGLGSDAAAVFFRALLISTLLAAIPMSILWFLDRRERANAWLLAAAFLWGGCIALRKRRLRDQDRDPEQDLLVLGWRRDIERLRGSA